MINSKQNPSISGENLTGPSVKINHPSTMARHLDQTLLWRPRVESRLPTPQPEFPLREGRASHCHLCHRRSACGQLHRHRATASAHCCCWAPGGHLISAPRGVSTRPCGQLWLQLQWQSLLATPSGSLSLLCSTSEAGSGPRHPSIYSSHTLRASMALMRAPSGKGMGLHPPAPHPQESRAVTTRPWAPRPSARRTGQS